MCGCSVCRRPTAGHILAPERRGASVGTAVRHLRNSQCQGSGSEPDCLAHPGWIHPNFGALARIHRCWALPKELIPLPRSTARAHPWFDVPGVAAMRSEEHTSELQSRFDLVCRLLLEKKKETRTGRAARIG